MIVDPPAPGKRPFGHPLPAEVLAHFRHPLRTSVWHHAYRIHGATWFGNTHCLFASTSAWLDAEARDVRFPDAFQQVLDHFTWHRLERTLDNETAHWHPIEDSRLVLFRFPPKPLWHEHGQGIHLRPGPTVRIGQHLVQLATLQLIARLPAVAIHASHVRGDPLMVRFRGGHGVVPPVPFLKTEHAFTLNAERRIGR